MLCLSNNQSPKDLCINLNGKQIQSSPVVICLGTYWMYNLSPKTSIEKNISKARKAYFALGFIGIHSNHLSPLIASEIFEVCVLPVCLYGCENWILTAPLLERFQAEIVKTILMLPPYHNNLGVRAVISWPSMKLRILLRKLRFLIRISSPDNSSISATIFLSLRNQNPGPQIVQCLFLEK